MAENPDIAGAKLGRQSETAKPTTMSGEVAFAEFLREQRRAAGYSQEDLAERAGLSVGAIGSLEQGLRRAPRRDTVRALAAALQMSDPVREQFEEAATRARGRQPRGESGIPISLTPFIERNEVNELKALLADHRLLMVTGAGGVGKTRTAIEVARRVEALFDETWFVDLLPIHDGSLVLSQIAARLNVSLEGQDGMRAVTQRLRSHCSLLVIDNCEHVIAGAGVLLAELLRGCPSLTVLATSREPLAVSGELTYRLPSMDLSTASDLFVARAQAADYGFPTSDPHLEIVTQICKELNCIPLAIELAASRAATLGLESLRDRLKRGIILTGSRDSPLRHRTMNATIAWSYDLLSDADRLVFQRLSVFFGSFTLEAAEEVCSDDTLPAIVVADSLSHLVEKSLINVERVETSTRYRLLDSIRAFAWERLAESGRVEKTMLRLIETFAEKARGPKSTAPASPLTELSSELDNVAAAISWAQSSGDRLTIVAASRLLFGFAPVWTGTRRQTEVRTLGLGLLELLRENEDPQTIARLIYAIAAFLTEAELFALAERAIPLLIANEDYARAAALHLRSAVAECKRGDREAAERHLVRGEALLNPSEYPGSEPALYRSTRAYIRFLLKDYAGARALLQEAPPDDIDARAALAAIEIGERRIEKAIEIFKGVKAELGRQPLGNRMVEVCANLAESHLRLGNADAAEIELREGISAALRLRPPQVAAVVDLGHCAGFLAAKSGRVELGARLIGACEQQTNPASLEDIFTVRDLAAKAIQDRLAPEGAEALRRSGAAEDLFELLEEFLAHPAAADKARPSATSSPRAASVTRASPN